MAATHRRRGAAQREAEAAALRAAVRPRFDIKTLQGSASYEFIAKGRAPTLTVRGPDPDPNPNPNPTPTPNPNPNPSPNPNPNPNPNHKQVRVGTLQVAPKVAAAAAVAAAGVVSGPAAAKVHVRVNAMRILPQPKRTRAVDVTTAVTSTTKREPPDFRYEEVTHG